MDCAIAKQKPFSIEKMIIACKIRKLSTKLVKPVLRYLSRRARTNAVSPSCCTYSVEEALQNELNEPFDLQFRFLEEENAKNDEALQNAQNEALEARLRGEVEAVCSAHQPLGIRAFDRGVPSVIPVCPDTYFAVPVQFVEAPTGGFVWIPLADADIPPHPTVTESQLPSQQVPYVTVA